MIQELILQKMKKIELRITINYHNLTYSYFVRITLENGNHSPK